MSIYVPNGYRLVETVFRKFISARFVQELKMVWEDYARIQSTMWTSMQDVMGMASERPPFSMEHWHRSIEDRYSAACTPPPRSDDASAYSVARSSAQELYRKLLENLRTAEAIERLNEDREHGGEPSSLGRCLDLLEGGCWGYWERSKVDLTTAFREEFIDGRRIAFAVAEDGSMPRIPAEWWRGAQCTEALMSQCFRHPSGDIVEKSSCRRPKRTILSSESLRRLSGFMSMARRLPDCRTTIGATGSGPIQG